MNIWSRLGVSVAIAALFCILVTEAFQGRSYYETYRWHGCGTLLATGALLWLVGRRLNARFRQRKTEPENPSAKETESKENGQPFLLINLAYWGAMLVVFGIIIMFINPHKAAELKTVAARAVTNRPAPPRPAALTKAGPEVKPPPAATNPTPAFPELKLQGVVYRLPDPSVLINGKTFSVGDYVGEAKVVAIDEQSATLEWNGQRKILLMPK